MPYAYLTSPLAEAGRAPFSPETWLDPKPLPIGARDMVQRPCADESAAVVAPKSCTMHCRAGFITAPEETPSQLADFLASFRRTGEHQFLTQAVPIFGSRERTPHYNHLLQAARTPIVGRCAAAVTWTDDSALVEILRGRRREWPTTTIALA